MVCNQYLIQGVIINKWIFQVIYYIVPKILQKEISSQKQSLIRKQVICMACCIFQSAVNPFVIFSQLSSWYSFLHCSDYMVGSLFLSLTYELSSTGLHLHFSLLNSQALAKNLIMFKLTFKLGA